jgi:ribulose-phosphate 3-epimerase
MAEAAGRHGVVICIDGGVTRENVASIAAAGADMIVTGSAVFDGKGGAAANARAMLASVAEVAQASRL